MKYIRTKDGRILIVIELSEFDEEERRKIPNDCTMVKSNNIFGCSIVKNENIIKQTDTIEELCDEFVWISINNEYHNRKANEYGLRTSKMQINSPQMQVIYGAIWTEWGLKYIAKMNERGELELI